MAAADRRRWTALIVEDDPAQRELAVAMLTGLGVAVEQAATAEEAIDRLCEGAGEVRLVIADVQLGEGLDGVELARRVSVLWPTVSLIVTSGYDPERFAELPDRVTFLPKPWALDFVAVTEAATRQDHSVHAVKL